ncbi:MAG: carbohydrate ABC transporter substrate-binding protein [Oscillospiraceae bacterium]|nr:carbohydrate ABC transporter substrate-binding protein [Oscillospiraceae bacterium]
MKKFLAMALALVMVLSLVACGKKDEASVYYLNFKPEADAAWQQLADEYTKATGIPVKVVTAASGTYEDTLVAEMDKKEAPTLFQVNVGGLKSWGDYCYDLTGTDVVNELAAEGAVITKDNGEIASVAYCVETYGLITNKALLKKAGYEVSDIKNFADLKKVAEDIHARSAELGFDAFSSAGLDGSSNWRFSGHLSSVALFYEFRDNNVSGMPATVTGKYVENLKNLWDLYTTCSATTGAALSTATSDMSEAEFGQGKAVFFQNGSWEYNNLVLDASKGFNMKAEDLTMIPLYIGVEGEEKAGLCTGTENYWAVNAKASEADIKATLDFLKWVVTSESGTTMMAEQFGASPFKAAKPVENIFCKASDALIANGNYNVDWSFIYTPGTDDWRAAVIDAISQYTVKGASWDNVKTAFVDTWAKEYKEYTAG